MEPIWTLNRDRCALIVVDMQNDFVTGGLGTKEARNIVEKVKKAVGEFKGDLIFTMDTHDENYLETLEGKNLPVKHCIKGTIGWQIVPELNETAKSEKTEVIIEKGSFGSPLLARIIHENKYDEVYLCGVCTGICVISNALVIKASNPDVPITVLQDLCACVTPESHETALKAMQTCQIKTATWN